MIKTGLAARRSRIQIQSDVTVTDHHCASGPRYPRAFHAKNISVKIAFMIHVTANNGHMLYLCEHDRLPSSKMKLP
jgi:hypothetical protein